MNVGFFVGFSAAGIPATELLSLFIFPRSLGAIVLAMLRGERSPTANHAARCDAEAVPAAPGRRLGILIGTVPVVWSSPAAGHGLKR